MADKQKKDAITSAFLTCQGALKHYLATFFVSNEDIEDTMQDAYVNALVAEKKTEIQAPKAYLFRVARNVALNKKKAQKKIFLDTVGEFDESIALDDKVSADQVLYSKEQFRVFGDAVSSLPPQCQRVFMLQRMHGLSYKAIAKQLSISERTVENHLAKALSRCRDYMKDTGYSVYETENVEYMENYKRRHSS